MTTPRHLFLRPARRRRRVRGILLAVVLAGLAAASSAVVAQAAVPGIGALAVSTHPDRSGAVALGGARLRGSVYVFVNRDDATSVSFYVDAAPGGTPFRVENGAPFDLGGTAADGTARPVDTRPLPTGTHRLVAVVTTRSSGVKQFAASFSVVRAGGTPTPTPTTTAPAACANPKNPWATLAACGWAGPTNTGYDASACPGGLTTDSGATTRVEAVTADDTVISCRRITGSLDIRARNVTIRDSVVSYDGGGVGGSGVIKFEDGSSGTVDRVETDGLDHTHACVWHQGVSVSIEGLDCHGVNDGVFSWADTGYSATTGDNLTLSDSYLHDFTTNAANGHIDGYQTEGANHVTLSHNTFLMTGDADSAVAIWDSLKSSSDVTVKDNLLTGGGFTVYVEDYSPSESSPAGGYSVTGTTFTNNTFSTHAAGCVGYYGVWYTRGNPTDGWHRSGNVVLETGEKLDSGNPHVNGVLCT